MSEEVKAIVSMSVLFGQHLMNMYYVVLFVTSRIYAPFPAGIPHMCVATTQDYVCTR